MKKPFFHNVQNSQNLHRTNGVTFGTAGDIRGDANSASRPKTKKRQAQKIKKDQCEP